MMYIKECTMWALVVLLLAGVVADCTALTSQARAQEPERTERQTENRKYLLSINRQKYWDRSSGTPTTTTTIPTTTLTSTTKGQEDGPRGLLDRARVQYQDRLDKFLESRREFSQRPGAANRHQTVGGGGGLRNQLTSAAGQTSRLSGGTGDGLTSLKTGRRHGLNPGPDQRFGTGFSRNQEKLFQRDDDVEGECRTLRSENELLKQILNRRDEEERKGLQNKDGLSSLLNLVSREEGDKPGSRFNGRPVTALDVLQQAAERVLLKPEFPFNILPQNQDGLNQQAPETRVPVITTTVLETERFETTVTEGVTRNIEIIFNGKTITTEIVNQEAKVVPTSRIITRTIEITATPTLALAVVPSPTLLLPTPTLLLPSQGPLELVPNSAALTLNLIQNLQSQKLLNDNLIKSSVGGGSADELDSFQSLQDILLKKIRERAQNAARNAATRNAASPALTTSNFATSVLETSLLELKLDQNIGTPALQDVTSAVLQNSAPSSTQNGGFSLGDPSLVGDNISSASDKLPQSSDSAEVHSSNLPRFESSRSPVFISSTNTVFESSTTIDLESSLSSKGSDSHATAVLDSFTHLLAEVEVVTGRSEASENSDQATEVLSIISSEVGSTTESSASLETDTKTLDVTSHSEIQPSSTGPTESRSQAGNDRSISSPVSETSSKEASSPVIEAGFVSTIASISAVEASSMPSQASITAIEASSTPTEASSIPTEASSIPTEASRQADDTSLSANDGWTVLEINTISSVRSGEEQSAGLVFPAHPNQPSVEVTSNHSGIEGRRRREVAPSKPTPSYIPFTAPPGSGVSPDDLRSSIGNKDHLLEGSFCQPLTVTVTQTVSIC